MDDATQLLDPADERRLLKALEEWHAEEVLLQEAWRARYSEFAERSAEEDARYALKALPPRTRLESYELPYLLLLTKLWVCTVALATLLLLSVVGIARCLLDAPPQVTTTTMAESPSGAGESND